MATRHPIQPTEIINGVRRFKQNAIVRYLLDNGGLDMNAIARMDFTRDDREQFAQLIGYSLDGFASLGYASEETVVAAEAMAEGIDETTARMVHASNELAAIREGLRDPIARLYGLSPGDLQEPTP